MGTMILFIATGPPVHQTDRIDPQALSQMSHLDRARAMALHALQRAEATFGADSIEAAHALSSLGAVLEQRAESSLALAQYLRAFAIQRAKWGTAHPEVARTCSNIGVLYGNTGQREKSEEFLRLAHAYHEEQSLPAGNAEVNVPKVDITSAQSGPETAPHGNHRIFTCKQSAALRKALTAGSDGYTDLQLLELVGLPVALAFVDAMPVQTRVLVLVGPGRNGRVGLVAARHLAFLGRQVTSGRVVRRGLRVTLRADKKPGNTRYSVDLSGSVGY